MGKVGVVLPDRFVDSGEFLADARAFEAAGVDSIWIRGEASDLDPWLLLAAVAAVTSQVRLGLILKADQMGTVSRQFETLNQLSRSRSFVGVRRGREISVAGQPGTAPEHWTELAAGSADALQTARAGEAPVLVPVFPGLLDLLRRPEQEDDRSDLLLAQG